MTPDLCLDYPLRRNFNAQLVLPRDLTELEAKRLCAFVMTLVGPEVFPAATDITHQNELSARAN